MDRLLMLRGEERHCADCAAVTIFLPLDDTGGDTGADTGADLHGDEAWVCTACDGAVVLTVALSLRRAA